MVGLYDIMTFELLTAQHKVIGMRYFKGTTSPSTLKTV